MHCVYARRRQWTDQRWDKRSPRGIRTCSFGWVYTCLYAKYGGVLRHPLRAETHDLSFDLRYGDAKHRAHEHDNPHHLPQLLGRLQNDSSIVIVGHHQGWFSAGCPPRPRFVPQMHQSVHDVFVHLEMFVGHVYNHREDVASTHP